MAHIVTLKDNNDEVSYPITPVDAVFVDSNTTLSDKLDEKADTDLVNVNNGAVTTAKIANGAVTANKIDWSTMPGSYSLNEIDTGYTWIDGNTIYKKTINFGALPNATSKRVAHGISNLDLIIKTEGYSKDSYNIHRAVPYTHTGSSLGGSVMDIESSDIVIFTDSDRSGLTAYITLYYTKSS